MPIDLNSNKNLDPRLKQIIEIVDRRDRNWLIDVYHIISNLELELSAEQFDHAMQDIRDTIERRMTKKKKWGIF